VFHLVSIFPIFFRATELQIKHVFSTAASASVFLYLFLIFFRNFLQKLLVKNYSVMIIPLCNVLHSECFASLVLKVVVLCENLSSPTDCSG